MDAIQMMEQLKLAGVGTRPFFFCMHEQPVFRSMGLFEGDRFPVAERLARRGFYLPSGLALTHEKIMRVTERTIKILEEFT
jgi:perosamine synthetase